MKLYVSEILRENSSAREAAHRTGLELLRAGLRKQYGLQIEAENLSEEVACADHGKPYLKNHPEIHFSISHSHDMAVCALADRPVGVDIEKVVPVREALLQKTLTEEEQKALGRMTEAGYSREELFFRFWTLKESYFKWDGCGLTKELKEIAFTLQPEEECNAGASGTGEDPSDSGEDDFSKGNRMPHWAVRCSDPRVTCMSFSYPAVPGYLLAWCMVC